MLFDLLQKKDSLKEMRIEDLWNAIKNTKEFKGGEKNFFACIDGMKTDFSSLKGGISKLNSLESDNKYSNIVKNKFCSRVTEVIDSITYPEGVLTSPDFCIALAGRINYIGSLSSKEFRHLHAFKNQMKIVAAGIKAAEKRVNELSRLLGSLSRHTALWNNIEEINNLNASVALTEQHIKASKMAVESSEKALNEKRNLLDSMLNSNDFVRLEDARKQMGKLQKDKETIERQINEEFASLERIFRKFSHLNAYKKGIISKYMNNSFSAFVEDSEEEIRDILEKIKSAADSGKLEIENKKYSKLIDVLRFLDVLHSMKQHYIGMTARIKAIKEGLDTGIENKIEGLKAEIEKESREIEKALKEAENKRKAVEEAMQRLGELKGMAENSASMLLGKSVRIHFTK